MGRVNTLDEYFIAGGEVTNDTGLPILAHSVVTGFLDGWISALIECNVRMELSPQSFDFRDLGIGGVVRVLRTKVQQPPFRCSNVKNEGPRVDRKSTRLNSSHLVISYA